MCGAMEKATAGPSAPLTPWTLHVHGAPSRFAQDDTLLSMKCMASARRLFIDVRRYGESNSGSFGSAYPMDIACPRGPKPLRSATVLVVKGGLVEKRKTMVPFSSFPQPRLRLLTD